MLFNDLDKWAYDIEKEYGNGDITSRERRQYMNICIIRDRLFEKYRKEFKKENNRDIYTIFKCCNERLMDDFHKFKNNEGRANE